jgi:hypothetical protein
VNWNWHTSATPFWLLGFYSLFAAAAVVICRKRGETWSDLRKQFLFAISHAAMGFGVALIAPSL